MVLPAHPAHASPAQPHWLDRLIVAIELSDRGVLTLVNGAAPARFREAYLRLRACDPATDVIIDVRRLAMLPPRTTVILALEPTIDDDDLDWLNLNRPVLSDRQLRVVLWCEDSMATVLAQRAPDLFDWISAWVDCPPAPVAHAVADVRAAILSRASGVAWDGPGLENTLAAIRPGRPVRRVAVGSYQSMFDALTSREPGWLVLEGIDTEFHLRRLRWAMAEARRRAIAFHSVGHHLDQTLPGWWAVSAMQVPIAKAVHELTGVGGTGRLAALTGLDPDAYMYLRFALRRGIAAERLEALLAVASNPRTALHDLAQQSGWTAKEVILEHDPQRPVAVQRALKHEAARHERDDDPIVSALREQPLELKRWAELGTEALKLGDFEVAIRWLTAASRQLANDDAPDANPLLAATVLTQRGRAHRLAGDFTTARSVLERAHDNARRAGDATLIATSATELGYTLLDQGEPRPAGEYLESALGASQKLGDQEDVAILLDTLARALVAQGRLSKAGRCLDRALSLKRKVFQTEDHPAYAASLSLKGLVLAARGDLTGAQRTLERSLEISERWLGTEHPSVGAILSALGHIHRATGDLRSARALLDRALAIQRATLGPDHPDLAEALVNLADVLAASGNLDDALVTLKEALAIQKKVFGNDGQLAGAATRQALAKVLVAKGDLTGALDNLQQALAARRRIHGRDDHPEITSMLSELAHLQELQRNLQHAD